MSLRWTCPECEGSAVVRTSKQPAPGLRELYIGCKNIECGWRAKAVFEVVSESKGAKL